MISITQRYIGLFLIVYSVAVVNRGEPIITDITESMCWFAGSQVENVFSISGIETERLSGQWRLSTGSRTMARGEMAVNMENGMAPLRISFILPELEEGAVVDLLLELSVTDTVSDSQLGVTNKVIRSFFPNPFTGREQWLESLEITLFDPEKRTAELFDDLDIPYSFTRNVDALSMVNRGIVIVGEGVSLKENRGLWDELVDVASRGIPVLCLALREGEMTVPGLGMTERPIKPSALTMKRHQAIFDLDKRLDQKSWCGERKIALSSLLFIGERGPIAASIEDGSSGWLWLEQSFENTASTLVLCQYQLVEQWEQSPVPRYLLLRLLERGDLNEE